MNKGEISVTSAVEPAVDVEEPVFVVVFTPLAYIVMLISPRVASYFIVFNHGKLPPVQIPRRRPDHTGVKLRKCSKCRGSACCNERQGPYLHAVSKASEGSDSSEGPCNATARQSEA